MPADRIHFLTVDDVLAIHAARVERFGGPQGVRDAGLLERALFRPQTGFYADLAFFATDVFLRLNGWKLCVDPDKAHRFLIGRLEKDMCDFDHLLPWIRRSIVGVGKR